MTTLVDGAEFGKTGPLVRYQANFLTAKDADTYFFELEKLWEQAKQEKGLFGVPATRRTIQVGDKGIKTYKYPGASATEVFPWSDHPILLTIKRRIEQQLGVEVNFVLANFYDPKANLTFHSDNEDDMEEDSTIVSISLGAVRRFTIRELPPAGKKKWVKGDKYKQWKPLLGHGSLLTMEGECQKLLDHGIPKMVVKQEDMTKFGGRRINLTYRKMQNL